MRLNTSFMLISSCIILSTIVQNQTRAETNFDSSNLLQNSDQFIPTIATTSAINPTSNDQHQQSQSDQNNHNELSKNSQGFRNEINQESNNLGLVQFDDQTNQQQQQQQKQQELTQNYITLLRDPQLNRKLIFSSDLYPSYSTILQSNNEQILAASNEMNNQFQHQHENHKHHHRHHRLASNRDHQHSSATGNSLHNSHSKLHNREHQTMYQSIYEEPEYSIGHQSTGYNNNDDDHQALTTMMLLNNYNYQQHPQHHQEYHQEHANAIAYENQAYNIKPTKSKQVAHSSHKHHDKLQLLKDLLREHQERMEPIRQLKHDILTVLEMIELGSSIFKTKREKWQSMEDKQALEYDILNFIMRKLRKCHLGHCKTTSPGAVHHNNNNNNNANGNTNANNNGISASISASTGTILPTNSSATFGISTPRRRMNKMKRAG